MFMELGVHRLVSHGGTVLFIYFGGMDGLVCQRMDGNLLLLM